MTRGLVKMTRFGVHFGAQITTFFGLSGMEKISSVPAHLSTAATTLPV